MRPIKYTEEKGFARILYSTLLGRAYANWRKGSFLLRKELKGWRANWHAAAHAQRQLPDKLLIWVISPVAVDLLILTAHSHTAFFSSWRQHFCTDHSEMLQLLTQWNSIELSYRFERTRRTDEKWTSWRWEEKSRSRKSVDESWGCWEREITRLS